MTSRWLQSVRDSLRRDSCGCATGTVFLGAALLVTTAWYAWHWDASRHAPWPTTARIVGYSMAASIVGKMIGILLYQKRTRRVGRRRVA